MDKRYLILGGAVLVLIILGVFLISSCNKTPKASELNLVTFSDEAENLTDYIAAFEAQNNTKIKIQKIDRNNYELESLNLLSTGKVDIWGLPNSWLPKQKTKLAPYSGKMSASAYQALYPKIIAQENIIDNKIYGLPISYDALVLFRNSDIQNKKADLTDEEQDILSSDDTNWTELTQKSQLLTTKTGSNITQTGLMLGSPNLPAASDILSILMLQYGTQMTNIEHTQATFHTALNDLGGDSFPGARALEFYSSFSQSDNPNYSFSPTITDPFQYFLDGKAAYYLDYSQKENNIKKLNPKFNFEVKALPQVQGLEGPFDFISYETYTVPNTSNNQILSWNFLAGLTSKESLQTYFDKTGANPTLSELNSANMGEAASEAIANAISWYNPEPTEVDQIFRNAISEVVAGQKAQTVLDGAAVQVTSLLEKIKE